MRRPPVVTPFARLARTHALMAAGDAVIAIALAGSLFFDISPGAARTNRMRSNGNTHRFRSKS